MVNTKEAVLSGTIIIASLLLLSATGAANLQGTIDFPSLADLIGGDTGETTKYKVSSSISYQAGSNGANLIDGSFEYDTEKCIICSLSFTDSRPLAFGGVDDAQISLTVYNSNGQKVTEIDRFIGEIGAYQKDTIDFSFTATPGDYRLVYHLTGKGDLLGQPVDSKIEKNIRVPETLRG